MEANASMQLAATLFGLAAGVSLLMALMRLGGIPTLPDWLGTGHNVLAAGGLAVLTLAAVTVGIPTLADLALILFFVAAISGVAASQLLHRKRLPIRLLVLRTFLASAGFVLLLMSILGQLYINKLPIPTMINTG